MWFLVVWVDGVWTQATFVANSDAYHWAIQVLLVEPLDSNISVFGLLIQYEPVFFGRVYKVGHGSHVFSLIRVVI